MDTDNLSELLKKMDEQLKDTPEEQMRYDQMAFYKAQTRKDRSETEELLKHEIESYEKELSKTKNKKRIDEITKTIVDLNYQLIQLTDPAIIKEINDYLEGNFNL